MTERKNKILFIINRFAPPITGGTIRVFKYTKYLIQNNWQVYILCNSVNKLSQLKKIPKLYSEIKGVNIIDAPGLDEVLKGILSKILFKRNSNNIKISVNKAKKTSFLQKLLKVSLQKIIKHLKKSIIPDIWRYLWVPFTIEKAKKIIIQKNIKNIITSSPSQSTQLIGLRLKRYFHDSIFWIADFRDLWSLSPAISESNNKTKNVNMSLERKIIKNADKNIFISESAEKLVLDFYKICKNKKRYFTITNGYDEDDFKNISFSQNNKNIKKLNINYIGSIFGPRMRCKYPEAIQTFLNGLIVKNLTTKNIVFNFIGNLKQSYRIRLSKMKNNIDIYPHLSHKEAITKMYEADILVVLLNKSIEGSIAFTGKIFEYLKTGKPILAICPKGEVTRLIEKYSIGETADPEDKDEIVSKIAVMIKKIRSEKSMYKSLPDTILLNFSRKHLTDKLISILQKNNSK